MAIVVSVGGNIGCGKSTVLRALESTYAVCPEPLDRWNAWMCAYYANPQRHALGFQIKILLEQIAPSPAERASSVVITERSPMDALYVFGRALRESGTLSALEYTLLAECTERLGWTPDVYIYLRTDPKTCLRRLRARARACETDVEETYLRGLHDMYETWIHTACEAGHPRVHVVDANRSAEEVAHDVNTLVRTLVNQTTESKKNR